MTLGFSAKRCSLFFSFKASAHTLGIVDHAIKVLDVTQAVTAQLQGVGGGAQPIVHDIKGALVLEGVAWVPIGDNDLYHGRSVHDGSHATTILVSVDWHSPCHVLIGC